MTWLTGVLGAVTWEVRPGSDAVIPSILNSGPQGAHHGMQEFSGLSRGGCDLLDQMLTYDPEKRIGAAKALRHPWLAREAPFPLDCAAMPRFQPVHLRADSANTAGRTAAGCVLSLVIPSSPSSWVPVTMFQIQSL